MGNIGEKHTQNKYQPEERCRRLEGGLTREERGKRCQRVGGKQENFSGRTYRREAERKTLQQFVGFVGQEHEIRAKWSYYVNFK